ncbi:ANTAR domain-containing protein, partial [Amycolatopsis sp. SID8362]|nr:ANTAR domain-containing protein [Amycolatopsis sp. SID8362]NED48468.1 ANTAR domain-containing protein [Amycolatopsis sp. SID8362]
MTALLDELLRRIAADVPGALGAAVSVHHDDGLPRVAATHGLSAVFVPAQLNGFG